MKRLLVIALAAVALTACNGVDATPTLPAGLEGTTWNLVSINGHAPDAQVTPTLAFDEDGNISGTAVCNSYTATARVDGTSIVIGPLATTLVACSGAAGVLERQFLEAMDAANAISVDSSGQLVLEGGDTLVFEAAPQAS
jgi:heat shock protein HslJ